MKAVTGKSYQDNTFRNFPDRVHSLLKDPPGIDSHRQTPVIQTKAICPCDGGCPRCVPAIQTKTVTGQSGHRDELAPVTEQWHGPSIIRRTCGKDDPGQIIFNNCSAGQLDEFAVIEERTGATTPIHPPVTGTTYHADGLLWRRRAPSNPSDSRAWEWYKVPDGCTLTVNCDQQSGNFNLSCGIMGGVAQLMGRSGWRTGRDDWHSALANNPFLTSP